uniref:SMODS and SLOG-associating 2TM effector domain-containing protein n=1 Tax=viral metagenome TaxID=1070528 RepID=A0A6C0AXL7_9ZZZZ
MTNYEKNQDSPINNLQVTNYDEFFHNKFNNTFDNYELLIKENREWDNKSISYINTIKDNCIELISNYKNEAKVNKKKHLWLSLVAILIPLIMAPTSGILIDVKRMRYVEMIIFIILSIINTIIIKFNYSKKLEKYIYLSIRYNDILSDIEYQLSKPVLYRENVNSFCIKIKTKYNYLSRNSFII